MGQRGDMIRGNLIALVMAILAEAMSAQEMPKDYQDVLKKLGKKGDYKDNVLKINIPRNDLSVRIDGRAVPTAFGFGGWLATRRAVFRASPGNPIMD